MALTNAQRNTLLTAVKASPTAGPIRTNGDVTGLLAWCNTPTAALAWAVAVPSLAVEEAPSYTTYDSLAQGKRDSWALLLNNPRNFAKNKIRAWVVDVWGNATAGSNSESVLQAGTEGVTNAQAAIGGSSKTTGTVTALDRAFPDAVSFDECAWLVQQA